MPKGAALSSGSSGELVNHFNGVRVRVNGTGSLQMTLFSFDDVASNVLVPITMRTATNIVPTRLANFVQHRASLELKTTNIDESMRVNRIVIFSKEIFTQWPSQVYT